MPGLAKCWRRADTSCVELADDFWDLDEESREDPGMRRGCIGRFPGSRKGTGTGIIWARGVGWEGEESQRVKEKEREGMCVF